PWRDRRHGDGDQRPRSPPDRTPIPSRIHLDPQRRPDFGQHPGRRLNMDHFALRGGVLHCEDVPLPDIAEAVGTPVYVYSTATMRRHVQVFRAAVGGKDPLVTFAVKANPNAAVLATLAEEGMGGDVVSIGEYRRAVAAGIAPKDIVFAGVGKTAPEMAEALAGGLCQFNL